MPQQNIRIRTGARTTSKVQEKELVRKAKALLKDPELILPECQGKCFLCPFNRVRRKAYKIVANSDDLHYLEKRAEHGEPISRAYAATVTLVHTKKAPFLGRLKTPFGEVAFLVRGKAAREKLIGVQYYDDPYWRLFSVLDIVKSRNLHIYSAKDKMYCTGKVAKPPKRFIDDTMSGLKFDLKPHGNLHVCRHIEPEGIKNERPMPFPYLRIDWISAGVTIAVCDICLRAKNQYLFGSLSRLIAARDSKDDFEIRIVTKPMCDKKCEVCHLKEEIELDEDLVEKYKTGELTDIPLLEKHMGQVNEEYRGKKARLIVAGGICYGKSKERFLKALNPPLDEEKAVRFILDNIKESVVLDRPSTNRFFAQYWDKYKEEVLISISKDKAFVKGMLKDETKTLTPSNMIQEASIHYNVKNILSKLPHFENISHVARFADEVGRVYKSKGPQEAERHIERFRTNDPKTSLIAAALLFALNLEGKRWQFAKEEAEFAQYIKPIAKKFLEAAPEEYASALQALISSTGSTEKIAIAK